MTRDDWRCPICKRLMSRCEGSPYMVCIYGHGKLYPVYWHVQNLPLAERTTSRNFWICGEDGSYQYVPHGHKTALDKAPAEGHVVASVAFRGGRAVRLFKRKVARKELLKAISKAYGKLKFQPPLKEGDSSSLDLVVMK